MNKYFEIENPATVTPVGIELDLRVDVGGVEYRGIIDRLDRLDDGRFAIVDYKTGRSPRPDRSRSRLLGVQFYAFLCERTLGIRPSEVRLMYFGDQVVVVDAPTDQSLRGLHQRATAVWSAIEKACDSGDFRPNPSPLCRTCFYQDRCPPLVSRPPRSRCRWKSLPRLPASLTGVLGEDYIHRLDKAAEQLSDEVRQLPGADRVFYTASALGDFGLIWVVFALLRALAAAGTTRRPRSGHRRDRRRVVSRQRGDEVLLPPAAAAERGRPPLAAAPAALRPASPRVMRPRPFAGRCSSPRDDPLAPLYFGAAAIVAASRVYVSIHHASDVVGGVVVGSLSASSASGSSRSIDRARSLSVLTGAH